MHGCPCCGDIIYDGVLPTLCDDCEDEGCELTEDSVGELGYWECERPVVFYDDDWIYT